MMFGPRSWQCGSNHELTRPRFHARRCLLLASKAGRRKFNSVRELIRPARTAAACGGGNALEYTHPAVLGTGSYGVAMAVTTSADRRIA